MKICKGHVLSQYILGIIVFFFALCFSLIHSSPDRGSPHSGTELFFATRTGTRLGIETHLFRAETTKDLSVWTRHIVNGCHASAEMIKEVSTSESPHVTHGQTDIHSFILGLSPYQNSKSPYQYLWIYTILDTTIKIQKQNPRTFKVTTLVKTVSNCWVFKITVLERLFAHNSNCNTKPKHMQIAIRSIITSVFQKQN